MAPTLNNNLRGEQRVKPQSLHVSLLSHSRLAGPKRILPPHVIPVVNVERQHDHRHIQLEIAPPQPRQQELRLRRGGTALRREQLNQNRAVSLSLLLGRLIDRGGFRRAVAVSRRASAETGEETAPHYVVVSATGKEGGCRKGRLFFVFLSLFWV